jgi:hypothetical protein
MGRCAGRSDGRIAHDPITSPPTITSPMMAKRRILPNSITLLRVLIKTPSQVTVSVDVNEQFRYSVNKARQANPPT